MAEPNGSAGDVEAAGQSKKNSTASQGKAHKVLSVSANLAQLLPTGSVNLAQLLPTGSVMAYQTLAPSFSNQGKCYPSNWWITVGLVVAISASCVFFAFTDSIIHNGKVYYGLAVPGRLNVFNLSKDEEKEELADIEQVLKKRGLKRQDFAHAFLAVVVFLTMAFSDVGLQNCFFPHAGTDTQQLLKNLPLGMAVFSSLVFTIFPTKRNFIGCNDPLSDKNETFSSSDDQLTSASASRPTPLPPPPPSHVCTCDGKTGA